MTAVEVVAVTQPLVPGVNSIEEYLAYVARVSNPSNQMNNQTAAKLLRYCLKKKHWSVFEQVHITMQIDTTRDISHQIIRHWSMRYQEFSQRYSDPTKDLQFVFREARLQDHANRQNSIPTDDAYLHEEWHFKQAQVINAAEVAYQWAIDHGIAKEQARVVLPEGNTCTRIYMVGSLRSWIHYCELRRAHGTQKEHQEVAELAWEQIVKLVPAMGDMHAEELVNAEPDDWFSWLRRQWQQWAGD